MKRLLLVFTLLYAQCVYGLNVQNCIGGIQVCQPVYTQMNSYTGNGGINELAYINGGCLYPPFTANPGESNSVWYIVTVTAPGLLVFTITPNQLSTDYDWGMWDITAMGCNAIFNYATNTANPYEPVRCNASANPGVTGLSAAACCPTESQGNTPNLSAALSVTTGQVFAICVNNWTGNTSGYTLDFSSSTASIYDTAHPRFDTIGTFCNGADSINFGMSEAVKCSSLDSDGSDFTITPALATPVMARGLSCGGLTSNSTTSIGLKLSAPLPAGNYVLHAKNGNDTNTLLDYCGNAQMVGDSIAFTVLSSSTTPLINKTTCVGSSASFDVSVVNDTAYTYSWSPGIYLNNADIPNPVATPTAVGDISYIVTATSLTTTCNLYDTVNLHVLPPVGFTLYNHDSTVCRGAAIQINAYGDTDFNYVWSPAIGVSNIDIINPIITPDTNGTYTLTASYPGCPSISQQLSFNIYSATANIITPDTAFCSFDSVQLRADATPDTINFTYAWTPATGLSNPNILQPKFFEAAPGSYQYYLTVTTPPGCMNTDSITIIVQPPVKLVIDPIDTIINPGASVQITATNTYSDALSYSWTPDNMTLSNVNTGNPIATPLDSITYTVTATNKYGCKDSGYVKIEILTSVFVPNAFTPNGDGKNDVFRVVNLRYKQLLAFQIYNRWGQEVFNTIDPEHGWDGKFGGIPAEMGIYDYLIVVGLPNGTEQAYKGSVTLIR